jgi:hypothetical protein
MMTTAISRSNILFIGKRTAIHAARLPAEALLQVNVYQATGRSRTPFYFLWNYAQAY